MGAAQAHQRTDGIGAADVEGAAVDERQAFGEHQPAVKRVAECQRRGEEEGHAVAELCDDAAQRRADDETEAECHADDAEIYATALGGRDIGEVRIGGRKGRAGDPGDDPRRDEPPQVRRERHDEIVGAEGNEAGEEHRAAAEAIRQPADNRAAEKLHRSVKKTDPAGDGGSVGKAAPGPADDQSRKDRNDNAEPDRIDEDGNEQEGQRLALSGGSGRGERGVYSHVTWPILRPGLTSLLP